ncbi:MAG: glycosyltransferase family 39 protein [Chloroflexota bacterium]|nr:glycosyltransferase family 39 protein [Dehalococcoidia bacterium]MDW8254749.1 glycosyltransferase family 39 protein [Chloroflexota bacterium]
MALLRLPSASPAHSRTPERVAPRHVTPRGLQLILAAFLAIGTVYLFATPPFEASDEIWHYPFVQFLQRGMGLPIQQPRPEDNIARQEGGQPPLYYALGAALTFWADQGLPGSGIEPNPHAMVGVPLTPGNKNLAIHQPNERWHGAGLAVTIIRFASLLMGAASVWLVHRLVLLCLPGAPAVALGAAAFTAFNPEFLFISAAVNNDNLMTLIGLLGVDRIRAAVVAPSLRNSAVLGLVLGLAALTKLTALGLLPLAGGALLWAAWRRRALGWLVAHGVVVFGLAALIAGWWYVRNQILYGEPTGLSIFLQIVNTRNPPPPIWELIVNEFEGFRISFWALFGGVNILADRATYLFYDLLSLLALAGLGIVGVRWWRARSGTPYPGPVECGTTLLVLAWLAIVAIALLRWSQTTLASQGRLLFPAMAGVALLFALGLVGALPRQFGERGAAALGGAMALVALVLPFRFILPAYTPPPPLTAEEVAALAPRLDIDFGDSIRLLAAEVPPGPYRHADRVPVRLTWQALQPMDRNYSVFVHLFARDNRKVGWYDTYPGLGLRPTRDWIVGEVYQDVIPVYIEYLTEGPVLLRVETGVYDFTTGERLPARVRGRDIGTSPVIGWTKLADPPGSDPPAISLSADFGGLIRVDGATVVPARRFPPGDTRPPAWHVSTWLAAIRPIDRDYTMFVHVVGPDGQLLTQNDGQPVENAYPTSRWLVGERVIDRREVPMPSPPVAGARLVIGFYDPATGARLLRRDAPGDALDVGLLEPAR